MQNKDYLQHLEILPQFDKVIVIEKETLKRGDTGYEFTGENSPKAGSGV